MTPAGTIDVTELLVRTPPAVELERKALDWPQRAAAVTIFDQESYDTAAELLKAAKSLRKEAEEHHRPVIAAAHNAHKVAMAALKRVDEPLAVAEGQLKAKIGIWDREQEMRRLEAERKAREEAERKAAEEFEKELEAAEVAGAGPVEVQALIREAERTVVVAPLPQPSYRPAAGISTRANWSATVTNPLEFIRWVGQNPQFSSLLKVDQVALNALARSMQSNLKIPGVRAMQNTTVAVR